MLAIEVEYLAGVAFASPSADKEIAEWPPQPDRLFSALVASWGFGARPAAEREALEWLELQSPPVVVASPACERDVVTVYVPPNDVRVTGRVGAQATMANVRDQLDVLPERRRRQARQFPATLPDSSTVTFLWPDATPPEETVRALNSIAARTGYLGHSASLVRVAAHVGSVVDDAHAYHPYPDGPRLMRWVYPGRLAELFEGYEAAYRQGTAWRPRPGIAYSYAPPGWTPQAEAPHSVFGEDWLILEDDGGTAPLITAFPVVAKTMHRALVEACASRPGRVAPELLTGTMGDGRPSQSPHLAIAPLADVGWRYSSGRLFGLALILPRLAERRFGDPDIRALAEAVNDFTSNGELMLGRLGAWRLRRASDAQRSSLHPDRYLRSSRRWATVTPLALDRYPKDRPGATSEELVARACEHIGLPRPTEVGLYKYSAINGAPPASPPGGNPQWTDWTFPAESPLVQRMRRHAVVEFAEEVGGPLLLGAGRYQGLGLCLPLGEADV